MAIRFSAPRWLFILTLVLITAGCASMNEDECRVADWRAIGYEDGVRGVSAAHIGERREACAEHGIAPDFAAYQQGREEGLEEFCTPASGYRLGRKGRTVGAICPANLQSDFRDAYKSGREIYQAAAVVGATQSKLKRRKRELSELRSNLTSKAGQLVVPSTDLERRVELVLEIQELTARKSELEIEISQLSVELDRHRQKLAALEHSSVY